MPSPSDVVISYFKKALALTIESALRLFRSGSYFIDVRVGLLEIPINSKISISIIVFKKKNLYNSINISRQLEICIFKIVVMHNRLLSSQIG